MAPTEVKHFHLGSTEPLLQPDKIYLYSMRFCPYAHRVHLTLNAKQIPFEPIYINLGSKPDWYLEKFPAGRVPALWYKNEFLHGSLLLSDFLDEEFPNNPLYPTEPLKKLKDRMLVDIFGSIADSFYDSVMVEFNSENFNRVLRGLDEFEKELKTRGTKYFGGDEPLMVDYMIWPWFERLEVLPYLFGLQAKIHPENYPYLTSWVSLMENDDAVKKHYVPAEIHAKHLAMRKRNDPGAFALAV